MNEENDKKSPSLLPKIFTNDPILFKSYVNKQVTITTEDSSVHTGIVYTIDPVSESLVLMNPAHGDVKLQIKFIMSSAIKNMDFSSNIEVFLPEVFGAPQINYTEEELLVRKNKVIQLLIANRFPITEEKGVLSIEDTVQIEPPYLPENCTCLNSIILNRIQTILSSVLDI